MIALTKSLCRARQSLSWFATAPIVVALIWLGSSGKATQEEMRATSQHAVRVAELRTMITNLDDNLALVTQMAAATGERGWVDRYNETAPKLDAAIQEAVDLATPAGLAALSSTMGEAHRDLTVMERRSLSLALSGDLTGARNLLIGPEYAYLQDVYANGTNIFGEELTSVAAKRAADLDSRSWLETLALGLSAILLGATALSVRGRRKLQGALARTAAIARTDPLTELPNRRHFYEEIEKAFQSHGRPGREHALMLIDLDRFKAANDAFGHPAGDELLRLVAARLRKVLKDESRIARLGGDEFAFIVCADTEVSDQLLNNATEIANRIITAIAEPFALSEGVVIEIGASVGVAVAGAGLSATSVMHQADVALYRAKANGRGCCFVFEEGMDDHVRERAVLEGEFRQALANGEIVPHFQPLVDIEGGRLVGVEMLARWEHETRGMIPPIEFIPIAEELDLIGRMTEQLLRRACETAMRWPEQVTLACNVSPLQLRDPGLSTMIRAVLSDTGFPACRLELEVTESALLGDLDFARSLLEQLKSLGIRLALDDFGTGYSSLRHLQKLPFDIIKIDRSFVGAMSDDKESGKIVSAVIGLGQSLGLSTVAEGVENAETAILLRKLGCDVGQGWLYGRPASADHIDLLLAGHSPLAPPTQSKAA